MNDHANGALHRAATPRPQRILVVCAANVCRSPTGAFLLGRALRRELPGVDWAITSAGANATPGSPMCRQAAAYVSALDGGEAFAAAHASAPLTHAVVAEAGLVLVASTAERAAVAALDPRARRRLFTMREAVLLAERVSKHAGVSLPLAIETHLLLPTIVDLLHDQRGTLAVSAGPAHFTHRRRRERNSQLDLADVHQGEARRHRPVLAEAATAAERLATTLARLVVPTPDSQGALGAEPERTREVG